MSGDLPAWSVRLLLTEEQSRAISHPDVLPMHDAIIRMAIGGFHGDEVEELPYITYELYAQTVEEAEDLAQGLATFSLKEAGLPPHNRFPVVWAAPLRDEPESSHRFLEQAKDLFGSEQFELAIVAAQIHFEIQVRLLLGRAAVRISAPWAQRLIKYSRVAALSNDVSTASVQLLLGTDVTASVLWPEYVAHLKRRNAIVHEGRMMSSNDAASSIKVVQGLWASLAEAERSMKLF